MISLYLRPPLWLLRGVIGGDSPTDAMETTDGATAMEIVAFVRRIMKKTRVHKYSRVGRILFIDGTTHAGIQLLVMVIDT